ncbi:hypothetical protein DVH24_006405 [Malus domestica]|uniref:RNA polymerase II transcription factor B subunit 2 n=1 Tax=Malus domestica TaxID=3750 RepID=A0A498KC92_MALDO|nr:hypothetical protein DVH24_006405 [Malus domestica]
MAVEFTSGLDDAWYDVLIANDGCDRLRVKFVGFDDDHDEDYEVSELSLFNDIDKFRRRFSTTTTNVSKKWAMKEVTKSNFPESLEEFKNHLSTSTSCLSRFDTADKSYCKAKYAAGRFQLLQFAACPFTLRASKLTPHMDILKMGMPTYSFSVQTSHLTSMVEEGFDFNACIYNVAMLVSPHLSFLAQDSSDLISFLVELSFHVKGEAYNINTLNERQKNIVKDLADLGLIKLQQALMAMLSPDFSLCLCLIPERVVR